MKFKKQITHEDKVVYDKDITANEIDGEVILMSIKSEKYYGLDTIGSAIWKKLDEPLQVRKLIEIMTSEYRADKEKVEKDILKFLNDLLKEGMIRIVS